MNLEPYCALNEEAAYDFLKAPFLVGDLVCANNRHIMICLETAPEDFKTNTPEVPVKFRKVVETIIDRKKGVELVDFPSWTKPDTAKCKVCNGHGFELLSRCPTCKGKWESGHWCKTCDDQGCIKDINGAKYRCLTCSGSGETTPTNRDRFVKVIPDCDPIDFHYMNMISKLQSIRIGALPERNGILFSFDGGFGFVMGGRV